MVEPEFPMASIEHFERCVYSHQRAEAIGQLIHLLRDLESSSGELGQAAIQGPSGSTISIEEHFAARATAALTAFATAPDFVLSPDEFRALMVHHGWLGALFAASGLGNADHVLRALSVDGGASGELQFVGRNLPAFCLFYFADSEVPLNIDGLWAIAPRLAADLFLNLLAAPFLGTPVAYRKQELLLRWLAAHLAEIGDLDYLPAALLYRVYMRCSYADFPQKHAIKRPINDLIRSKLRQHGFPNAAMHCSPAAPGDKPSILVVVEWFQHGHSIHRTHSAAIEGLRSRFRVLGVGYAEAVDDVGRRVFDEFHALSPNAGIWANLREIADLAASRGAQLLYMPSVGMSTLSLFASNLRVTPRTVIGLGHPATTHSAAVDLVAVEEDFIGEASCFSESLLLLPKDGQPYRPGQAFPPAQRRVSSPGAAIQIAVVATTFKLNPRFLAACAQIAAKPGTPVHLHFFVGNASGLTTVVVRRLIERYLGRRATVYPRQPYADYMQGVGACDLFINAFPFGNTNGIVDTVSAGLVGVCKTGPEVHEHIDEALFRRLGLPQWLVTKSDVEYVTAVRRLVDDDGERQQLSRQFTGPGAAEILFQGQADSLAERLYALWRNEVSPDAHAGD